MMVSVFGVNKSVLGSVVVMVLLMVAVVEHDMAHPKNGARVRGLEICPQHTHTHTYVQITCDAANPDNWLDKLVS